MAIFAAVVLGLLVSTIASPESIVDGVAEDMPDANRDSIERNVVNTVAVLSIFPLVFLVAFAAGPFVPRNRFGWIYGIVLIALGIFSAMIVVSVPLLLFWMQKDSRHYYGMG